MDFHTMPLANFGTVTISGAQATIGGAKTAIDSSPAALEVARGNAADLGVAERIELVHSDLFEALPAEVP